MNFEVCRFSINPLTILRKARKVFKKNLVITCLLIAFHSVVFSEEYAFEGRHYVASFKSCDMGVLNSPEALFSVMEKAINASGATILDYCSYEFDPEGYTLVFLLSESHASVHTYPEYGHCFIDLFTCGTSCDALKFHEVLSNGLAPKCVDYEEFYRD